MALTMQAIGCSSRFASGATLIVSARRSTSPSVDTHVARNLSPRSCSLSPPEGEGGGEDEGTGVNYEDLVAAQWLSADFLDLRLRSSGLICNEAIQALRNHFQRKDGEPVATSTNVEEHAAPSSASQIQSPLRQM